MSITFTKVVQKTTPNGMWDNGLYRVSDEKVNFPKEVIREAVLEDYVCKGVHERCMRITVYDKSWIVLAEKDKTSGTLRRDDWEERCNLVEDVRERIDNG